MKVVHVFEGRNLLGGGGGGGGGEAARSPNFDCSMLCA